MSLRRKVLLPMALCALALVTYLEWGPLPGAIESGQRVGILWTTSISLLLLCVAVALAVEFRLLKPLSALLRNPPPHVVGPSGGAGSAAPGDEIVQCAQWIAARDRRIEQLESDLAHTRERQCEAEAALRLTEERYVMAVRGANDGLWEWNLQNDAMYLSPRWKSLLGFAEEDVLDSRDAWRQRVVPEDLSSVEAALAAHLEGKSDRYEHQHRLLRKDGGTTWVLSRGSVLRHASGRPYRMVGLDTDITRVKRVEMILSEIAEGTAGASGSAFFSSLVRHFAAALKVPAAFITECADQPVSRLRTLAFWSNGGFLENFEYDLPGTPCEAVVTQRRTCFLPRGTGDLFPVESGYEGYLGIPIIGSAGTVLGHLAFLSVAPMDEEMLVDSIYRIFTARAAAELERKLALAALQQAGGGGAWPLPPAPLSSH